MDFLDSVDPAAGESSDLCLHPGDPQGGLRSGGMWWDPISWVASGKERLFSTDSTLGNRGKSWETIAS